LSRFVEWRRLLTIAKPDTLIRWHRKGFRLFWCWKSRAPGRPPIPADVRRLIATMATANQTWGEERIAAELLVKLGIRVLAALEMPPPMTITLSPLCHLIEVLDDELARADAQFEALVARDPMVQRLTTLPGIGPITASACVAALDDVSRFERAGQVTSYLGLVPQEYSSGEKQRRGCVMRSAHPQVQSLLVQAAWRIRRSVDPRTAAFRTWAQAVARRRGTKVAMVALARRLARSLFAMWRDQTNFEAARIRMGRSNGAVTAATTAAVSM
jgi:transposase